MKKSKIGNFFFLISFFIKYGRVFFIFVTATCFFTPLFTVLDLYLLKYAISSINDSLLKVFAGVSIILGLMLFINFISNFIEVYLGEKLMVRIRSNINKEIFKKAAMTDTIFFQNNDFYNNYSWSIDRLVNQAHAAAKYIWNCISSFVTIASLIALMVSMDFFVILFSIASVCFATLLSSISNKLYYKKNDESIPFYRHQNYINRLFYLKEYAIALKTSSVSNILLNEFDNDADVLVSVACKYRKRITLVGLLEFLNSYVFLGITIVYLCYKIQKNDNITVAEFATLIVSSTTLKNQLTSFLKLIPGYQNICLNGERIKKFFDTQSMIENSSNSIIVDKNHYSFEIKNISFKYTNHYVLQGLCLNINAKEKIAIVGENGAGKTTLVNLLLRLYDPDEGNIIVNSNQLTTINLEDYRSKIGLSMQNNLNFALTIRQNMQFYNRNISDETILHIFELVGFDRVIKKNSCSLDSYITKEFDKNGIELSGGELQMLSICRLFTQEFGLIILDEPSSSLDPLVESHLNDLFVNCFSNSTVILISHRLANVRKFDRIIVIGDKKVLEDGTHDELMNAKGKYYEMFKKQSETYL